jgi:hypothetical protein
VPLKTLKKTLTPLKRVLPQFQTIAAATASALQRKQRKKALDQTKAIIETHGYVKGTAYPHPQPFRVAEVAFPNTAPEFAELGSTATLPNTVLFELNVSPFFWQNLTSSDSNNPLQNVQLRDLLHIWQRVFYKPFITYMNSEIGITGAVHGLVPSRSDTLRKALKESLTTKGGSNTESFPIMIVVNAGGLEYARPVNAMPSKSLRHMGEMGRTGQKPYKTVFMFDPRATKGWWGLIQENGRKKIRKLFVAFLQEVAKIDYVKKMAKYQMALNQLRGIMKRVTAYNVAQMMFISGGFKKK